MPGRGRRRLIPTLIGAVAVAYAAVLTLAWLQQDRLVFPSYLVAPAGPLPADAERIVIEAPDGVRLEGVRIPPAKAGQGNGTLVLGFAGNASNAQDVAEMLHELYPERDVAAFFYRGYAPSAGAASAEELLADAPFAYDVLIERYRPERVVAVGVSLGSGVAAGLAAQRPLDGLVLVTPFDSLKETARQLHPWLPVSLLLRHDIRSADLLRDSSLPVAIVAAERDRLVRPERTARLREAVPNLVFDATIPGAAHNDIALHPGFRTAMREAMERIEERARP